ncbi:hypothetical protein DH2020_003077 [Rehmannia glutinosa]|uniref:Protein kinase domain-containing protein n=1 Tax=Rehmannia glutinosa TaxID=99300 RepID=A0ABR0XKL0_REHGL
MDALDQGLQCSYFKNGDDQYRLYVDKVLNNDSHGSQRSSLDKKTGQFVAVKQEFHGLMSQSTRREIGTPLGILNSLPPHPSIAELKEAIVEDSGLVFVVMEYLSNDLKKLMDLKKSSNNPFTLGEIKRMMKQLLEGITFLHENEVMHRDLKPSNILIDDSKDQLKIFDFGLSRCCYGKASGSYTLGLVTLWYRAPELLLGAKEYSCAIDMWSVGCIMAERRIVVETSAYQRDV